MQDQQSAGFHFNKTPANFTVGERCDVVQPAAGVEVV